MLARGGRYLWPPKLLYHRSFGPTQHKRHWQPHFKNLSNHLFFILPFIIFFYKSVSIQERLMCTRCCWLALKTIQTRLGLPRCGNIPLMSSLYVRVRITSGQSNEVVRFSANLRSVGTKWRRLVDSLALIICPSHHCPPTVQELRGIFFTCGWAFMCIYSLVCLLVNCICKKFSAALVNFSYYIPCLAIPTSLQPFLN